MKDANMNDANNPTLNSKNWIRIVNKNGLLSPNIYDPIAKVRVAEVPASYDHHPQIGLLYIPGLLPEMFEIDELRHGTLRIENAIASGFLNIAVLDVSYEKYDDILLGIAKYHKSRGIGIQGQDVPYNLQDQHNQKVLGYRFRLAETPEHNKAIASYLLKSMLFFVQLKEARIGGFEGQYCQQCAVAIDSPLSEFVGLEGFEYQDQIANGLTVIAKSPSIWGRFPYQNDPTPKLVDVIRGESL